MYAQLGSITFEGQFTFASFSSDGNEARFAQLELLNSKPRLQKTGDTLEEISILIKVHARQRNPKEFIQRLQDTRSSGEVLPLLLGSGQYLGDYVIISTPYEVTEAFADGTIIQTLITITIREHIPGNKVEQQQQEARKRAFAVGDVQQVLIRPAQPVSDTAALAKSLSAVTMQTAKVDGLVSEYENNVSKRPVTAKGILESCDKANAALADAGDKLDNVKEQQEKVTAIRDAAANVRAAIDGIKNNTPPNSIDDLRGSNTYLQGVVRVFKRTTTPVLQAVVLRKEF